MNQSPEDQAGLLRSQAGVCVTDGTGLIYEEQFVSWPAAAPAAARQPLGRWTEKFAGAAEEGEQSCLCLDSRQAGETGSF